MTLFEYISDAWNDVVEAANEFGKAVKDLGDLIVITISEMITKSRLKRIMLERGIEQVIIREIDNCSNVINLEDLQNKTMLEVHGESISDDLYEREEICIY